MRPGERLYPDSNAEGRGAVLRYQSDGNVVLYDRQGAIWATDVLAAAGYLEMQHDGNLVAYDAAGTPYWASDTNAPGASLEISRAGLRIVADGAVVWEVGTGLEAPPPAVQSMLHGQVRIVGQAFHDDTGPCLPFQCHAGDLIGQGLVLGFDRARHIIDEIADAGYPIIRSWFQLKITTGSWIPGPTERGWNPLANVPLFRDILAYGAERGVKWNLSGGGIKGLSNSEETELFSMLRDVIGDIGAQHFFQVQAANEVRDTGDRDDHEPAELERLVSIVRAAHPDILYSLTAYTGHEDKATIAKYTTSRMRHAVVHGSRDGHFWDKYRHIFSLMRERTLGRDVGGQDEPFGVERKHGEPATVSAQANGHELDQPGIMEGAAVMSLMCRQWWTFMSGSGVVYHDFTRLPGFYETPKLVEQLPRDLMTFRTLSHSHPSQVARLHTVRGDSPDVREDYAIHDDGRFVAARYGDPRQSFALPQHRAQRAEVILDVPGVQILVGQLS